MKFKALLAATAVAAASLATPAHAHHPETAKPILRALHRIGVTTNTKAQSCGGTAHVSNAAGTYNARTNHLCLKHWDIIGSDTWYKILVHEAWHAVQDGLEGIDNSKMSAMAVYTHEHLGEAESQEWLRKLMRANTSSKTRWAYTYMDQQSSARNKTLEFEAVMVEEHPGMVLHGLQVICKHEPTCY